MSRMNWFGIFLLAIFATPLPVAAANLVIYDDQSENGFNQGCSFGGVATEFDFANSAPVHGGTHSIRFTPDDFNAVSWCTPATYSSPAEYNGIDFWVNGGATGGQDVDVVLGLGGNLAAAASLATLYGAAIPAGTWVHVQTSFTSGPLAYSGQFDQISLQGEIQGTIQPDIYFDDIALLIPASQLPDKIFKNGFEASAAVAPIFIEQNINACSGLSAERYTWQDAGGQTRSATFGNNSAHGSELCDFTYHTDAATVRDVQPLGGAGGFGYIVSHLQDPSIANNHGEDDSPLGSTANASHTTVLQGRHHAIQRFQLNYPRWGIDPVTHVQTKYNMPVTIDWLIATGRDHPLWTASFDLNAAPANAVNADSRAPYGEMAFDGQVANPDTVMGVAWGDHYKFTTPGITPVTFNSAWDWSQPNTIPHVYLWTQNADAEMGIVQSEDIGKQDAGGYDGYISWTNTSANGAACTAPFGDGANGDYKMPCDFNWPYQSIQYAFPENGVGQPNCYTCTTDSKRLAWGADWGFLGYSDYPVNGCNDGGCAQTAIGYPYQSYATYIVLNLHSLSPSTTQISQVENAMSSTLSASVGSVVVSGPGGVNRSVAPPDAPRAYQPAGYNRVYATWDVDVGASANAATITLNAGGSGLKNPIFVLHNYTSPNPPTSVTLDGAPLAADAGYFATVDPVGLRLWITINSNWTGSHPLVITP